MANDSQSYDLSVLRRLLREAFIPDELEELVSYDDNFKDQKFGDLDDEFAPADSIRVMARKTVDWCERHGRIPYLVQRVEEERPEKFKEFEAKLMASGVPETPAPLPPPSDEEPDSVPALQSRWPWIAVGLVLVLIVAFVIVWLLFYRRGSLQVTRAVDTAGVVGTVDVPGFTICIEGESYPSGDCRGFNAANGWTQTWENLIPDTYTIYEKSLDPNWGVDISPSLVTVKPGNDPAQATATYIFQSGSLTVDKTVVWSGATPKEDQTFEICIEGASYPSGDCKDSNADNGWTQTWENLIPDTYTISEKSLGPNWDVDISPSSVTVNPGDDPAQATATYIFQSGSLTVDKTVVWSGATPKEDQTFKICIEGESYPSGDCKSFNATNGWTQTWENLIPDTYTISENPLDPNWGVDISPSSVTVNPSDEPAQATATAANIFRPGSLQITRAVDTAGAVGTVDVPGFTICIEGESYLSGDCKGFNAANGWTQTWENLIPATYTIYEKSLGPNWDVDISPSSVTVNPGDDPAQATATAAYIFRPGSLQVTREVDTAGAVGTVDVPDFAICIKGESYLSGDCKDFDETNGWIQTWENLIPDTYTISENSLGPNWGVDISPSSVTVKPGDEPVQATATYTFQPGSLQVTKVVDVAGAVGTVDVPDFTICIEGPSYLTEPDCKTFSHPDDLEQTWSNLIPGDYTVTERDPDANWTVTLPPTVTVNPGDEPAQATVTNTLPTTAIDSSKWTNLPVEWPCEFEGSLPWGADSNGLWCERDKDGKFVAHRLSITATPEDRGGFDIWWPSGDKGSFRVLRPGTAYEARFIPYLVEDEASYGIAIKTGQDVIYRFRFRMEGIGASQTFDIQLLEESPDPDSSLPKAEKGSTLRTGQWVDPQYRLRIERHNAELVFRWKAGPASQEWSELHRLSLQSDENYQLGLTMEGLGNVLLWDDWDDGDRYGIGMKIMSSAHVAPPPSQQEGIVVVDDSDPDLFRMYPDDSSFYSRRIKKLGAVNDSMKFSQSGANGPSRAEWCPILEKSGEYEVQVHIPSRYAEHEYALYEIRHAKGVASVPVNQYDIEDEWVVLGVYEFTEGQEACVSLSDLGEQECFTGYDAVRWIPQ